MPYVETMTPRQRVLAALNRQRVDRPPVANPTNVATVELMALVDAHGPGGPDSEAANDTSLVACFARRRRLAHRRPPTW